jgi:hypothetical protein
MGLGVIKEFDLGKPNLHGDREQGRFVGNEFLLKFYELTRFLWCPFIFGRFKRRRV